MKMVDYVYETSKKYPNNVALDFMGNKITYKKLISKIEEVTKSLKEIGVSKDDIVCIAMPNIPSAIYTIYALNKIGAIVNMIHPLSSENEFLGYLTKMKAKYLLILDQFYNKIKPIISSTLLKKIIVSSASDFLPTFKKIGYILLNKKEKEEYDNKVILWNDFIKLSNNNILEDIEHDDNKTSLILYSGGTTGKVKGVCLSNNNVNDSALQMIKANPMINSNDRFLSVMPIFHGNGLVIGIHAMLLVGARCVLIPRFTPSTYAKDLIKNKCNYMSGVPALFERLMDVKIMQKANLSFLKGVFSGADYLSVELEKRINDFLTLHHSKVKVRQGYGMTEGVVATTLNPITNQKIGSLGLPLPGVNVKIVKPDTIKELETNEVGEIVFSSSTNMVGYFNDENETNLVMKKHDDGKIWIHSGDLGYLDEEGYLFFKGRIKRMIVTNGYNVFPNELENIIEGFEMVDRCCILGILNGSTEKIKAFIVLKNGYEANEITKKGILELAKKSIAKYALPKEIEFIEKMPTTKIGKVDYNALLKNKNLQ